MKKVLVLVLILSAVVTAVVLIALHYTSHSAMQETTENPSTPASQNRYAIGVLTGTVTLSPTCPVEQNPPEPQCAPRPYASLLDIAGQNGSVVEIHAGTDGHFWIQLIPGAYSILSANQTLYPRCPEQTVTISAYATTTANISCDSGIR